MGSAAISGAGRSARRRRGRSRAAKASPSGLGGRRSASRHAGRSSRSRHACRRSASRPAGASSAAGNASPRRSVPVAPVPLDVARAAGRAVAVVLAGVEAVARAVRPAVMAAAGVEAARRRAGGRNDDESRGEGRQYGKTLHRRTPSVGFDEARTGRPCPQWAGRLIFVRCQAYSLFRANTSLRTHPLHESRSSGTKCDRRSA